MGQGNPTGGSQQLAELIDKHGEVLIPDLKHHFGIDLRDLFSEVDPLSPRWVLLHVSGLPMGSAFVAELRGGPQFRGWDEGRYLQAGVLDAIRMLQYILVMANSDPKKSKPKPPQPYPLPDSRTKTKSDKPGSFAFIAKQRLAEIKRRKEGGAPCPVQEAQKSVASPSGSSRT